MYHHTEAQNDNDEKHAQSPLAVPNIVWNNRSHLAPDLSMLFVYCFVLRMLTRMQVYIESFA